MKGYVTNIAEAALTNDNFRRVLYTDERIQLVLMCLAAKQEIGEEVHDLDQLIRVEEGEGHAVLEGETHALTDGSVVIVPAGTRHNIVNTSESDALRLYTVYAPPQHPAGLVECEKQADAKSGSDYETSDPDHDPKHECS